MYRIVFLVYYFLIGLPLFLLLTTIVTFTIVVVCALGYGHWASQYPGRVWGRLTLWLHWCPIEIHGLELLREHPHGQYVVVANHQSSFDIYALYGYIHLPFKWVLKEELRQMPLIGWACQSAGFIFVDDTKPSSIAQTMTATRETLSQGSSIFIFPEGSRTNTGKMTRFKKGAFVMASELDVPILPITIDGAFDVLPRNKWLPRPNRIRLTIHPPFAPRSEGEYPACIAASARRAQQVIASVLPREQSA